MSSADPSYPLLPTAYFLSAVLLLFVLLNSFVRQCWNVGVVFLCFWLFVEALTNGANHVIWSDNTDVRFYAFCDIVSHVQWIGFVTKPMSTFLITRRLYLIVTFRSLELPSKSQRYWNFVVEWTFGLLIPLLVAGPFYYIHQRSRFEVQEVFGCISAPDISVLQILMTFSWGVFGPLLSISLYYPRVIYTFYHHSKDIDRFLHSSLNPRVSRTNYFRILALASIDILVTLPMGVVNVVLLAKAGMTDGPLPFYRGWAAVHARWAPTQVSYAEETQNIPFLAMSYFSQWSSPLLAFFIFGLFGLTDDARASYWRVFCIFGKAGGWRKPTSNSGDTRDACSIRAIEFATETQESIDSEIGFGTPTVDLGPELDREGTDKEGREKEPRYHIGLSQ